MKPKLGAVANKEIRDLFRKKSGLLLLLLLSTIISYSFYSAVDLYSKASLAAVGNPLYASGFEPVPGVFVPTFGGLFVVFSLIAPFLFIQPISDEKRYNTLPLIAQLPFSLGKIYLVKILSSLLFVVVSILITSFTLPFWFSLGGHVPLAEFSLLLLGHFLYGLFVVSVSFFAASLFEDSAQASILALFLIMLSWFIDFGKDMNLLSFLSPISDFTVTRELKYFEGGVFSLSSVAYFLLLSGYFFFLGYLFFDFTLRKRFRWVLGGALLLLLSFWLTFSANYNLDLTESRRNSFSHEKTEFLRKLPELEIKLYLDPSDSRARDFESDFLKRMKLMKRNVRVTYAPKDELDDNYGYFEYRIDGKSARTYSNSEEEIFMILQDLSGLKLPPERPGSAFRGYPLVVKTRWTPYLFLFYLIILPLVVIGVHYFARRRR